MLPVQSDPALVLSGLPRPAVGLSNPLASLTPGEAVQATVLDVLDDGMLLVLVKGLALQAASLAGHLPVGQVFDAQVESRDGQVLLRMARPAVPAEAGPPDSIFPSQSGQAAGLHLAALLRTLLPADEPLSSGLTRFAGSLSQAVERGELPPQALADFNRLRSLILLEGEQGGASVAGRRLGELLSSLGLAHERELLEELSANGQVSAGSGNNLKGWLMRLLPASDGDRTPGSNALPVAETGAAPRAPALASAVGVQGEGHPGPTADDAPVQPAAVADGKGRPPVGQAVEDTTPKSSRALSASVQRGEAASRPVLPVDPEPDRPEARLEREPAQPRQPAVTAETGSRPAPAARLAAGAESPPAPEPAATAEDHEGSRHPAAAALPLKSAAGPAAAPPPFGAPAAAAGGGEEAPAAQTAAPREPAWVRDAQQVLTVLERTQTLASLNTQSGQPFCFDLPLAWGGQGQARIYVESRDGGERGDPRQPRPYNVVTLLELDGLGAVRVDTVLTGKRLSARFLLDQPAVERLVAGLLPALTRSLAAKGYQIDVLTSGTSEAGRVRGEDLRIKATPKVSLVNFRA